MSRTRVGPGLAFQLFALVKFLFTLYLAVNRPWTPIEIPFVLTILALDAIFLVSATFQDRFTLAVSWLIFSILIFSLLFSTLFFSIFMLVLYFHLSDVYNHKVSEQSVAVWEKFCKDLVFSMRRLQLELHIFNGLESDTGMPIELIVNILGIGMIVQLFLVHSTCIAQQEEREWKEKKATEFVV
ncbi:unnamed protein product [Caenorhabditis sp. 36 PRJEB53466]|nr:unnamed protein product [Caenorhabditis sp. 36 PRJEB53466]